MSGNLITWVQRNEETLKGYITGHPETTLFLITAIPDGRVKLCGAFIPNDEEHEIWDLQNAKAAAEGYVIEWLETVGRKILSSLPQ